MNATIGKNMPPIAHGAAEAFSRRLRARNSGPRGSPSNARGPFSPASAFRMVLVIATRYM